MRLGEGILTVQIIGFICILNENFWPVGLGRVEFVGYQKIPGEGEREEMIYILVFFSNLKIFGK